MHSLRPAARSSRRFLLRCLTLGIPVLFAGVVLAALEIRERATGEERLYVHDPFLGWKPALNHALAEQHSGPTGRVYPVKLSYNEHGFRWWGYPDSVRQKILFIGDSYTGDPNVSDEDAYFGIVAANLPVEVFAYGSGGYGTLQEMLVLEQFAELIATDIFVLQYCGNDITNNSMYLEGRAIARNQKHVRPYFEGGKIIYREGVFGDVYRFLYTHS